MKKICNMCGEFKDLDLMCKNSQQKDGYIKLCLACKKIKGKENRDVLVLAVKDREKRPSTVESREYAGSWLGSSAVYL